MNMFSRNILLPSYHVNHFWTSQIYLGNPGRQQPIDWEPYCQNIHISNIVTLTH